MGSDGQHDMEFSEFASAPKTIASPLSLDSPTLSIPPASISAKSSSFILLAFHFKDTSLYPGMEFSCPVSSKLLTAETPIYASINAIDDKGVIMPYVIKVSLVEDEISAVAIGTGNKEYELEIDEILRNVKYVFVN